jgi:hypothetical protein
MVKRKRKKPLEPELIVAHLLGGTSGLNLSREHSPDEIKWMVKFAVQVMEEIRKQCKKTKI